MEFFVTAILQALGLAVVFIKTSQPHDLDTVHDFGISRRVVHVRVIGFHLKFNISIPTVTHYRSAPGNHSRSQHAIECIGVDALLPREPEPLQVGLAGRRPA